MILKQLVVAFFLFFFFSFLYYEKQSPYCGVMTHFKMKLPYFNLNLPYGFELESWNHNEYAFVNFEDTMILISKGNYLTYKDSKIRISKNIGYAFDEKSLYILFESENNDSFYFITNNEFVDKNFTVIPTNQFKTSKYYKDFQKLEWIDFQEKCNNDIYLISEFFSFLFKLIVFTMIIAFLVRMFYYFFSYIFNSKGKL